MQTAIVIQFDGVYWRMVSLAHWRFVLAWAHSLLIIMVNRTIEAFIMNVVGIFICLIVKCNISHVCDRKILEESHNINLSIQFLSASKFFMLLFPTHHRQNYQPYRTDQMLWNETNKSWKFVSASTCWKQVIAFLCSFIKWWVIMSHPWQSTNVRLKSSARCVRGNHRTMDLSLSLFGIVVFKRSLFSVQAWVKFVVDILWWNKKKMKMFIFSVLDVAAFERVLGTCMDILMRNIEFYEEKLVQLFGSKINAADI